MGLNLSQKIKDVFDIIRALGSYLTIIGISFILFFTFKIEDIDFNNLHPWLLLTIKVFAILLFLSPVIIYFYDRIRLKYIIVVGKLSGYIIEKHETIVDIYDFDGKNASFFEKVYFHKFSRKTRQHYLKRIDVSGKIISESIQTQNCYYSLNTEQNSVKVSYVNNIKKLNNIDNYFKKNDKFLIFHATLKDTFISNDESWNIDVLNLCQDYNIQIILPEGKKLKYARFVRINNPDETIEDIQPIILDDGKRQKIYLQVMNFDKNEHYSIKWGYC